MTNLDQLKSQIALAIEEATAALTEACDANASTKTVASKLATIANLRAMHNALTA